MYTSKNVLDISKPLSKRSVQAFRLLVKKNKMMTGGQIAKELNVNQQNIYRILQPLVDREMLTMSYFHIRIYKARPKAYAQNGYLRYARGEFELLFAEAYDSKKA